MKAYNPHRDSSWLTPYLRALEITRVPNAQRPWKIRYVEQFAEYLQEKSLPVSTREDGESFIASLRSEPGAEEWKAHKATDALRLLITAVYGKRWEQEVSEQVVVVPTGNTADPSHAFFDTQAVRAFLERLVTAEMVSASTQSPALNALVFWFKQARGKDLGDLGDFQESKRPRIVPVVLARSEVGRLLAAMTGDTVLMAGLLYGSGLRLQELITLRVKDLDLERDQITVREGQGRKDRLTVLSKRNREELLRHRGRVRTTWASDLPQGYAGTPSRLLSSGSTLAHRESGLGGSSSPRRASASSRGPEKRVAPTWTRVHCKRP